MGKLADLPLILVVCNVAKDETVCIV